ncbi:filamentous hemagglutinin N-terminal domain-containing protein, partial [Pelomonas sp. KK5]|uniref:two-partner secretion domain-containing protein n=1 Tax=Pelomonas sp. KK5 TaxID=1855730 RepID=UPI001301AEFC
MTKTKLPPLRTLYVAACLAGAQLGAAAAPQGGTVVAGQATITGKPNGTDIAQSSSKAIIDWNSFSLASGELLKVEQPSASAVLLNRVVGVDPSLILGQIQANGRVFVSNPNGVILGAGSRIDAGGFLATTLSLSNADFLAGRIQLTTPGGSTPGALRAEGEINAPGGTVALVAPDLTVTGSISAQRVGLAAVASVKVDVEGDGLIFFNPRNDEGLPARLTMLGKLNADGGTAEMRAQARAGFADSVLNLDGIVQARSLGLKNGRVVIDGGTSGVTTVAGSIDVSGTGAGEHGGSATVLGDKVALSGSIDASGMTGGGSIELGGGFHGEGTEHNASKTWVTGTARLRADALGNGDGGTVVVWSDDVTHYFGKISARGGPQGGNGGSAEVSGKGYLDFGGQADLTAPQGRLGQLLLDPQDITIGSTDNVDGAVGLPDVLAAQTLRWDDFPAAASQISATTVQGLLGSGAVVLEASRDISVTSPISSGATNSLTLNAGRNISVGAAITITGDLTLAANHTFTTGGGSPAAGSGAISFSGGTTTLSAANVTLSSDSGLALPTINAGGLISVTLSSGNLSQAASTTLTMGADGSSFTTQGNNRTITLNRANVLNGHSVALSTTGSNGDAVLTSADAIKLAASSIGGSLTATANAGSITQTGALSTGSNGSSFTATGAGNSIDLSTAANSLTGLNTGGVSFTTPLDLALRVTGNLVMPDEAASLTGKLVLISDTGNITQGAAFSVGADGSSFTTSTAGKTITLSQANLLNGHTVSLNTTGASGDATIKADALKFAASSIGGKLAATASAGSITQTGAISTGATGSSFTATGAGNSIDLSSAANSLTALNTGGVSFTTPLDLSLRVTGDLVMPSEAASLAGKLVLISDTGNITQGAAFSVGADGSSFTTSTAGKTVTLSQANHLNGHTVSLNTTGTAGDATIKAEALKFAASSIGGKLDATASAGSITQTGAVSTGATGSSFVATGAGNSIDLSTQANSFAGLPTGADTFTAPQNLMLRNQGAILAPAVTLPGKLVLISDGGAITQSAAFTVGADGNSFSGTSITLTQANTLAGKTVALGSSGAASLKADSIKLATSGVTGALTLNATSGSISQTGVLTLGSNGNDFSATTASQTITLTQANLLGGNTIALHSGGDASLTGDAIAFAASTIGGKLTATASTGALTQTGVLNIGADGSTFTTSAPGQSITLTQANVLNGHWANLFSGGDASLTADEVIFGTTTVAGKFVAIGSTGVVAQVGPLSIGADGSDFTTQTAGKGISLSGSTTLNGKTVALHSAGDATINADAIKFAASSVAGKLTAVATTGTITQTGALDIGADGSTFTTNTAGQAITLTDTGNQLHGHDIELHGGGDVSVTADALLLTGSTIAGKLVATATTGSITQNATFSVGADGSSFTTSTANQTIVLTQGNTLNGKSVGLHTSGAAGDASITASASLVLAASDVGGRLFATATNGSISQSGAVTTHVGGSSFSTPNPTGSIDLGSQANNLAGLASGADGFSTLQNLSLRNLGSIVLPATTLGGALVLVSDTGSIGQTGIFTVGADGSSFTTSASNQTISLGQANVLNGKTVALHTSGASGSASLTADAIKLAASNVGGPLTLVASTGAITQTGALTLNADGSSFTTSTAGQAITLTQANLLNGHTVALHSGGDAALTADAIQFAASTVGGKLVATASTGAIGQNAAFSVNADGSSFTTTGQAINLSLSNQLHGKSVGLTTGNSSGDVSITSADSLVFDTSNIGGRLTAVASAGSITQTGVIQTHTGSAGTPSSFTAVGSGHGIDLSTQANQIAGLSAGGVLFSTQQDLALRDVGSIQMPSAGASLPGKLVLVSDTGSISQTGAFSVGADGSTFTTSTANQTISLTQANLLNGHTVSLNTAGTSGSATLNADAIKLAQSNVGGALT